VIAILGIEQIHHRELSIQLAPAQTPVKDGEARLVRHGMVDPTNCWNNTLCPPVQFRVRSCHRAVREAVRNPAAHLQNRCGERKMSDDDGIVMHIV
jgi:hypothetical protein